MAAEIQWNFITDKYSLVDFLDLAIVAARFKEKNVLRDLISLRGKLLEISCYEELKGINEILLEIKQVITDQRLTEIVKKMIEQITAVMKTPLEIDKKVDSTETEIVE